MIAPDWNNAKYFKPEEVVNAYTMHPDLLLMLDDLRRNYGKAITITRGYQPLDGQQRKSAHQVNKAGFWEGVDIRCGNSRVRYFLEKAAYEVGFTRIGSYDRHLHLDVAKEGFDQDVHWIGVSK